MEPSDPTVTLITLNRYMVTVYILSTFVVICHNHAHCTHHALFGCGFMGMGTLCMEVNMYKGSCM